MNLYELTIHEAAEEIARGRITSEDLIASINQRISEVEDKTHTYVTTLGGDTVQQAPEPPESPLSGIPLAIKDNIITRGIKTTCSSRMLENFVPPYDATVVERLRQAGAVFIGKTNLDEFAMGSSTETSYKGVTKNPWDLERIPGGSSGGSAAAVAADECIAAIGSDTGGSIRQPAAHCGVVGMKPTYGRVSRFGLVAFASSLDQIGPITKDVTDCALLMNVLCGHDPRDSTSLRVPVPDFTSTLTGDVRGLTIGVPAEYFVAGIQPEVDEAVRHALALLESRGAALKEVSLPHTDYAVATYYILATAEASSNLARYDGVKYGYRYGEASDLKEMYLMTRAQGFGLEVKRRIMLGTYVLSAGYYDAYYRKAQQVRTLVKNDFDQAFQECDVLITPSSPTTAFRIGEKVDDPLQMYLSDILTISVNLAGIPGISIPCGFDKEGLPVGVQILGRHFDEESLIRTAYAYEQQTDWHKKRPAL